MNEPQKLPVDPNWCPQVGEVFREGWFTISVVSQKLVPSEHSRPKVEIGFVIQNGDEQADFSFQASPVGNGRAFRSAVLQAIALIAVKS